MDEADKVEFKFAVAAFREFIDDGEFQELAKLFKSMFDSYRQAGFTEQQALFLISQQLNPPKNG